MKTAISIPDPLFAAAESASRRMGMSRSQFYSKAVEAFLKANRSRDLKDALNAVYSAEESRLDPALAAMQEASLPVEEW
jgi:metal-responsive CopG/Arc/MetJ family transcriptional regulator